jgi:hypothetical protein
MEQSQSERRALRVRARPVRERSALWRCEPSSAVRPYTDLTGIMRVGAGTYGVRRRPLGCEFESHLRSCERSPTSTHRDSSQQWIRQGGSRHRASSWRLSRMDIPASTAKGWRIRQQLYVLCCSVLVSVVGPVPYVKKAQRGIKVLPSKDPPPQVEVVDHDRGHERRAPGHGRGPCRVPAPVMMATDRSKPKPRSFRRPLGPACPGAHPACRPAREHARRRAHRQTATRSASGCRGTCPRRVGSRTPTRRWTSR